MKEDNYSKNLANEESGLCAISYARYSEKCFNRIYKASYGDAMLTRPGLRGTNLAARNRHKHLPHEFSYQRVNSSLG